MADERVLYQFPISHYCEKARWCLDAKGLAYRVRDILPGLHRFTLRGVSGTTTVPVLVDRGVTVADSTAIARHLDAAYPETSLLPRDEGARAEALAVEELFGNRPGRAVRVWMYGQLGERPGGMVEALFGAYGPLARVAGRLVAPLLERLMRKQYRIDPAGIAEARTRIDDAFDEIERRTKGDPRRYIAGDALSVADVTAASMMGPLVAPDGSPWAIMRPRMAPSILEARAHLSKRPGWAWVEARYARDRAAARAS